MRKDSSMRGTRPDQEREADACVSAGNTGALMATARFVLKTIAGVDLIHTVAYPCASYTHLDLGQMQTFSRALCSLR
jgi:glycerol-3-phosphate acyltransferase PlsX